MSMKAYKGFDKNMQCRGFQFAEGETYHSAGFRKIFGCHCRRMGLPRDGKNWLRDFCSRSRSTHRRDNVCRGGDRRWQQNQSRYLVQVP